MADPVTAGLVIQGLGVGLGGVGLVQGQQNARSAQQAAITQNQNTADQARVNNLFNILGGGGATQLPQPASIPQSPNTLAALGQLVGQVGSGIEDRQNDAELDNLRRANANLVEQQTAKLRFQNEDLASEALRRNLFSPGTPFSPTQSAANPFGGMSATQLASLSGNPAAPEMVRFGAFNELNRLVGQPAQPFEQVFGTTTESEDLGAEDDLGRALDRLFPR